MGLTLTRRRDHLVGPKLLRVLWPLTTTNNSWLVGSSEEVTAPLLQASNCYLLSYAWAKVAFISESTIASTFDGSFPPLPSYSDFCHQIPHWLSWESPTSHFHCKHPCCPPFLPTVQNQPMKPGSLPLIGFLTALLPRSFQFHQDDFLSPTRPLCVWSQSCGQYHFQLLFFFLGWHWLEHNLFYFALDNRPLPFNLPHLQRWWCWAGILFSDSSFLLLDVSECQHLVVLPPLSLLGQSINMTWLNMYMFHPVKLSVSITWHR